MTSLPDRPDLHQLRIQAKELKRALSAGESEALNRVLASHPKFAGRPAERLEGWSFALRDAQVTIAREVGFDSWKALVNDFGHAEQRWDSRGSAALSHRAFKEAQLLKQSFCTQEHFLLALLNPPQPTIALQVLNELGITYDGVRARASKMGRTSNKGASSTQSYQLILGWAQGIAIGMAQPFRDEHALLALAFGDMGGEPLLVWFDLDPQDVVELLGSKGAPVPDVLPPAPPTPVGPFGPWVYFPTEVFGSVTKELVKDFPPGTVHWGTNRSKWKKGFWYVHGEDTIPMEQIVRRGLKGKHRDLVEVLTFAEGMELEKAMAPRRYRPRPKKETS